MIIGKTGCGLQYAVKKGGSAVAYCALSIRCGTRDEKGFPNGIAHFTEHTVFKGTLRKSAATINGYLDRLGGELNAYTTKEEIVFHATVLKEDLPKAASLLLELATDASFPEEEIRTEQGVVIDEIKSYKDSPSDDVYDRFEEALFAGHPLSSPILGTERSVKKITSKDLHAFVKDRFVPWKMALTVVAPLEEKKMENTVQRLVDKVFSDRTYEFTVQTTDYFTPELQRFDKTVEKHNHEVNAVLGCTAPSLYEEKDRLTAILLSNILGGPASNSLLNSLLREKHGWVYGVESSYTQYADTGILAITFGCDRPNVDKCVRAIGQVLDRLMDKPLSEGRLKAAKKQLLGQLAASGENGETQCLAMGKSLLAFGTVTTEQANREKIEAITAAQLQAMARKIFAKENLSRLVFL